MPDIFDQIHSEVSGSAPPAPAAPAGGAGGDIFDQIHAQAQSAPMPGMSAQAATYMQSHPGMDPQAVQTAFNELPAANEAAAYAQKFHMDPAAVQQAYGTLGKGTTSEEAEREMLARSASNRGAIASGAAQAYHETLGKGAALPHRALAVIDKALGFDRAAEGQRLAAMQAAGLQGNPDRPVSNFVGATTGQLAEQMLPYHAGTILHGINEAGGATEEIERRREQGQTITPGQALVNVGLHTGLDAATSEAGQAGITGKLGKSLPLLKRLGVTAGAEGAFGAAQQVASNAIDKYTGVDEKRGLLEGTLQAAGQQALIGTAGHLVHEGGGRLLQSMRERKAGLDRSAVPVEQQQNANPQTNAEKPLPEISHETENRPDLPSRLKGKKAATEEGTYANHSMDQGRPAPVAAGQTEGAKEPAAGEHPARIGGGQPLADYVAKISPDSATAPLIGTMTEQHGDFVKARVPIDQLHTGEVSEEVVGKKVGGPQKNPAVTIPGAEGLDVIDGNHTVEAARRRGDTHAEAYVPESMVGKNGIEAVDQTARTSAQVQTERPQMFGARKGTVAVPEAVNKLVERDIAPKVEQTKGNIKASLDAVNRFVGTGANLTEKGRDTAIALRESEAQHEVDQARTETAIKPYRDILEKMTPDERTDWVDRVESGGATGRKDLEDLEEMNRQFNEKNKAEGEKYGLNTTKWDSDWIGRLASFPKGQEAGPGGKTRGTLAGSQKFLKRRTFDTFSDFKNAVEDAGGKLKYENPADMLLAKQMEVRRSIEARKLMYEQEQAGQLKWTPDTEKAGELHDTKLNDPLAQQTRDVVAPKWMVAKLLNLPHAEAEQYLKSPQWKNKSQMMRPGDQMPQGYAKSGEQVTGTYHADANAAGLFNNLISKGFEKDVPVLSQIADLRRRVTALNLAVPTAHAALTTVSNAVSQFGLAMEAAAKGHWDLAAKNAYRAINPAVAARFGKGLREQAANPEAHPELEPTVQTSMKGGNKFDLKSVLNETAYQKAKTEWEAGNKAGAVGRGIKAVYHAIEAPLFEHYIPDIKAAAKGAAAEIAIRDGLSGKELSRKMALAQDNVDNLLGMVKRSHQFQNRILTDLQDVVFTAPKFAEGTFRFAGAVGRDTFRALKDVASGKKPTMTPAMYSAVAGVLTHMTGAAIMQMAYSAATTGKPIWPASLEDYFKPRTGRKDDAGRDERVSILSPFSALFSATEHGVGSVTGRVAGLWKAAKAEMTGVDEQGRKLEGMGRLKYAGKQLLPYSVQNLMEQHKRGETTPDKVAGSMLGMHFSHEGSTPAERAAWDVIHAHYQSQPMGQEEADKSDLMRRLVHERHVNDPAASTDTQTAIKEGKISGKDLSAIRRRAAEKPGLAGLLHSTEIDAKSLMSQVWPKMTPDERKQFRLVVRAKIGRSGLPYPEKQELWKQTDQP